MNGRRVVAAAVSACVALALAGCASNPQLAQVGTPTPDPLTATALPAEPDGGIQPTPAPLPVLTKLPSRSATSLPWSLQAISADGRTLTVVFPASCVSVKGVQREELANTVVLTIWAVTGSGACAASLTLMFATVRLAAPLGDRQLLHAPVSRAWSTGHYFS